jgi:hypothetical protein
MMMPLANSLARPLKVCLHALDVADLLARLDCARLECHHASRPHAFVLGAAAISAIVAAL